MRISDWSSDVCSSDLPIGGGRHQCEIWQRAGPEDLLPPVRSFCLVRIADHVGHRRRGPLSAGWPDARDRQSGVKGKSVAVRVDHGGCRLITKKKLSNSGVYSQCTVELTDDLIK